MPKDRSISPIIAQYRGIERKRDYILGRAPGLTLQHVGVGTKKDIWGEIAGLAVEVRRVMKMM